MKSTSHLKEKHQNHILKTERFQFHFSSNTASLFLYLTSLALIILFGVHLFNHPANIKYTTINNLIRPGKDRGKTCNFFKGQWIPDSRDSLYTNYSCTTLPLLKNCFLNGRKDTDFLHWKWKPDECELPLFSPTTFLITLQGKTMAFIGDSLARNQMESLLCLLSTVETPKLIQRDLENRFTTWEFSSHNFTLMVLWSQFLVAATGRVINGSATGAFDLHLDRIDTNWSRKLPSIDYAIFSDAHWFFRQNHLYEGGKLIGCVYCDQATNVTAIEPGLALRRAFRAALDTVNKCKNCRKIVAFLRTYSPAHFENGEWNKGGSCNRTRPLRRGEVDKDGPNREFRKIQMEEVDIARMGGGNRFEILDVTEMMSMRADAHPGAYWGNRWMKGYSDCTHWCLPGPVDVWNELLLELIKRQIKLTS